MRVSKPIRHLPASRKDRGLALIEALSTSMIVASLTAVAASATQTWVSNGRADAVSDALMVDLREARSVALSTGTNIKFTLQRQPAGTCYLVYFERSGNRCECDMQGQARCPASATLIKREWIASTQRLTVSSNATNLNFESMSGLVTPAASIELVPEQGGRIKHVISITGRVRRCSPDGQRGHLPRC